MSEASKASIAGATGARETSIMGVRTKLGFSPKAE